MKGFVSILILLCIVSSSSCLTFEIETAAYRVFNVLNYGAAGNGKQDASQAFLRAWRDVCGATGALPILLIPAGKTFLLKPVTFQGPCRSNRINILLSGSIVAPYGYSEWGGQSTKEWIIFSDINGLSIKGNGIIDGRGGAWWDHVGGDSRPKALCFHKCNGLVVTGTTLLNSPKSHMGIDGCRGVHISHVKLLAPDKSPNTDGIDISQSSYVNIHSSKIATGDDCIAINGFSSHINISNIFCGPGHGISIGSLGENGAYETVEEVHVRNSTFIRTQNGVRIKTWQGGRGYVRNISFKRIVLEETENPIIIDQHYVDNRVNGYSSDIKISDITYRNIRGSSADEVAIKLDCSSNQGCTNIVMNNIYITSAKPGKKTYSFCKNVHGRVGSSIPTVSCLNKVPSWW